MKWVIISSILCISITSLLFSPRSTNNVCKTFADYYGDRDKNENCYYNPDINLNASEIIKRRGYPLEEHVITTEDGYILTMFRIPYGKNSINKKPGPPVLIVHGVLLNSGTFVNRGNKSLAFQIADAGFDVWLGNFRGTIYSKSHLFLNNKDKEYWNFDTYELSRYDLKGKIDLIHSLTGEKIILIGYSFGSAAAYMYSTALPLEGKHTLKIIISLAPAIFLGKWKSVTRYITPIWKYLESPISFLTNGEVYLRGSSNSPLRKLFCLPYPIQMYTCQFMEMLAGGFDYDQNDPETLPVTILQNPDSTSYKTMNHGFQILEKGTLDYYDHGDKLNTIIYGSTKIPQYNLSAIMLPSYIIYGKNDLMISEEDIMLMDKSLPKEFNPFGTHAVSYESFTHLDFFAAKDIIPMLYDHLIKFLNNL